MSIKKYSLLLKDFSLNFMASIILTGTIQLIVYPYLSRILDADSNGLMLTIMGIVNVAASSFGGNLFYARIIQEGEYNKKGLTGDYQLLLCISVIMSVVVIIISEMVIKVPSNLYFGIFLTTIVLVLQTYYLVIFRLRIDYISNFFAHMVMCIGYIVGVYIFGKRDTWPWLFCVAGVCCLIYIWFKSDIIREPLKKTELFSLSLMKTTTLIVGGFVGNVSTYLDRFMLYPLLGGSSVSHYTVSSFFAKTLGLIVGPLVSVLLSYFAGGKILLNRKKYYLLNIVVIIGGVIYLFLTLTIGKTITKSIYPTLFAESENYMLLASIGTIIWSAYGFNNVVIIAIGKTYWQTVIPAVRLALYFLLGIILVKQKGLNGLCIALIAVNLLTNIVVFILGDYYVRSTNYGKVSN